MKNHPIHCTRGRKRKKSFSNFQGDKMQNYNQQHRRAFGRSSISSQASMSSYGSLTSTLSSTSLSGSPPSTIQSSRARPCLPQLHEKETFDWQHYHPLNANPQPFPQELYLGQSRVSSPPLSYSLQRYRGSSFSPVSISSLKPKIQPGLQLLTTTPSLLQYFHFPLKSHNWLTHSDWLFFSWTFHWRCELKRKKEQGVSFGMEWLYDAEYEAGDFIMDPRW